MNAYNRHRKEKQMVHAYIYVYTDGVRNVCDMLIHICTMPHSCVQPDACIPAVRIIHTRDVTRLYV